MIVFLPNASGQCIYKHTVAQRLRRFLQMLFLAELGTTQHDSSSLCPFRTAQQCAASNGMYVILDCCSAFCFLSFVTSVSLARRLFGHGFCVGPRVCGFYISVTSCGKVNTTRVTLGSAAAGTPADCAMVAFDVNTKLSFSVFR